MKSECTVLCCRQFWTHDFVSVAFFRENGCPEFLLIPKKKTSFIHLFSLFLGNTKSFFHPSCHHKCKDTFSQYFTFMFAPAFIQSFFQRCFQFSVKHLFCLQNSFSIYWDGFSLIINILLCILNT